MVKTFKFFNRGEPTEEVVWRTAKGRHTPIGWMTTLHITNCIRCIEGDGEAEIPNPYFGRTHNEWLSIFEQELHNRQ